jgi:hypothetical protein
MTSEPCAQCPWRGGCRLAPGRLRELRATCAHRGVFICHKSQRHPRDREVFGEGLDGAAVCSGWAASFQHEWPAELQIADRLGFVARVDVPAEGRGRV